MSARITASMPRSAARSTAACQRAKAGLRIGVEGEKTRRPVAAGIAQTLRGLGLVEIQAGEVARVGVVAKAHVDRVGAVVDGGLERRQVAGGTDQLHSCLRTIRIRRSVQARRALWVRGSTRGMPCRLPRRASSASMPFSTSHFFAHHSGASRMSGEAVPVTR